MSGSATPTAAGSGASSSLTVDDVSPTRPERLEFEQKLRVIDEHLAAAQSGVAVVDEGDPTK